MYINIKNTDYIIYPIIIWYCSVKKFVRSNGIRKFQICEDNLKDFSQLHLNHIIANTIGSDKSDKSAFKC
jgi:hypothetical protein